MASACLVALSLGVPPPVTQGADTAEAPYLFTPEERTRLCAEFELGGVKFRARSSWHAYEMICEAYENERTKKGFNAEVVIHLYESPGAARAADIEGEKFEEYKQSGTDGAVYSYVDRFIFENGVVLIGMRGWPRSEPGVVRSLERTAKSIIRRKAGTKPEYRISIDFATTPFVATIKVTDDVGDPLPDMPVQVLAFVDQLWERYHSAIPGAGKAEPPNYTAVELVDMSPAASQGLKIDDALREGRRWLTDRNGIINVPLFQFSAVSAGGSDLRTYTFVSESLFPKPYQLSPLRLTLKATLFGKGQVGTEKQLATSEKLVELDHVARLVAVRKRSKAPTTITLDSGGVRIPVTTADLEPGGIHPGGFQLRPGDVIEQGSQVTTVLDWIDGRSMSMTVREGRGPYSIEIRAGRTSKDDEQSYYSIGGLAVSAIGVIIALRPNPVSRALGGSVAIASLAFTIFAPRILAGVDIVEHSVVLVDVTDEGVVIHTVEGSVQAYDRASDGMAEVVSGQAVTLYPDSSFGPVTEFQVHDLDEEMLAAVRSVAPESVAREPTEATPMPSLAPEPTSVAAAPSQEPPASEAARDLWLHQGDTVTRVDHLSGAVLGRWDVSHPDCPSADGGGVHVQPDGEAAWLPVVDAEWETPVLECVIRLPLDGSAGIEAYPVPTGRKPTFVNGVTVQDGDLWAVAWKKKGAGDTLEYYADWSLTRLDRWTGALTPVLPGVVAMAPSEAGLVVLYSEQAATERARRPLHLGIVELGRKTPRELPVDVPLGRTKRGTYVAPKLRLAAGHEGSVAIYDEFAARDIIVFDPTSGTVIGRVTPPEGATAIWRVWPVSDGVWMRGLLESQDDFVRYVPFDGWTSLEIDPCTDIAADCYGQVETASDAGAWISTWPYDDAFEVDVEHVVMRRFDATGQLLAEISGRELFGEG